MGWALGVVGGEVGDEQRGAAGDAEGVGLEGVGAAGAGKTTLLKQLVTAVDSGGRRYGFFFDLSLKGREESFTDFLTRTLVPYSSGSRRRGSCDHRH
jgi:hypothetical protein